MDDTLHIDYYRFNCEICIFFLIIMLILGMKIRSDTIPHMHVSDCGGTWSVCDPDAWAGCLEPIPCGEMPCSALMWGVGMRAWRCGECGWEVAWWGGGPESIWCARLCWLPLILPVEWMVGVVCGEVGDIWLMCKKIKNNFKKEMRPLFFHVLWQIMNENFRKKY